jgi:Zn-dependent protease
MALTFLIANKMSILDPSNLLLYLVVAGLAILLHDIAHRYMAWKYRVVSEYKVWWLGATIMFMTSGLFNVAYATPAKAKVGEGGTTLTRRQEAFIAGAGPLISFAAFLVFALMLNLSGPVLAVGVLGASMNLLIAVYSMMPFRPMDGSVVRRWNFFVWLGTFLPMFILYFAMAIYVW